MEMRDVGCEMWDVLYAQCERGMHATATETGISKQSRDERWEREESTL